MTQSDESKDVLSMIVRLLFIIMLAYSTFNEARKYDAIR